MSVFRPSGAYLINRKGFHQLLSAVHNQVGDRILHFESDSAELRKLMGQILHRFCGFIDTILRSVKSQTLFQARQRFETCLNSFLKLLVVELHFNNSLIDAAHAPITSFHALSAILSNMG